MKYIITLFLAVFIQLLIAAPEFSTPDGFRNSFRNPSVSAHPGVFWYWMNGNVTEEGIKADMKAFYDVGVRWVHQMDIGVLPPGKMTYHSDEWYRLIGLALQEANKYGINMHFNGPGWAVSGGPWITPEHSMKELAWSEQRVEGGRTVALDLKQPTHRFGFYKDIAVLAFPSAVGDTWGNMMELHPVVTDNDGKMMNCCELFDNDYTTEAVLPMEFEVKFERQVPICAVYLRAASKNRAYKVAVEGWDYSTGKFVTLAKMSSVDPGPFSPLICDASFDLIKTDRFRVLMQNQGRSTALIEELAFYGSPRVNNWVRKSGCGTKDVTVESPVVKKYDMSRNGPVRISEIIDLTDKMTPDGRLRWECPKGNWTILRMGYTPTGNKIYPPTVGADGLEVDKMSRKSAELQYTHAIKAIAEHAGPKLAAAMKFQHVDSYEAGWQTWTEDFDKEFAKKTGYDIISFLPAMTGRIVENPLVTEQFLWDMRKVISDLFIRNFYKHTAELGRADGLKFSNEPYGGPFNFLNLGAVADVPMIEFWVKTLFPQERKINFHGVSAGRTNGRKVIASETFTSGFPKEKWDNYPYSIKSLGDYVYCSGVNRFIMHVSAMQPFVDEHLRPGVTCGVNGIHFDRSNTWWNHGAREWCDYLTRCQSMLQTGEHVADALYFQGDEAPGAAIWFAPALPVGYDCDGCGLDVFMSLDVKDGKVVLPTGKSYRYLVLPAHGGLTFPMIEKVEALLKKGAAVIGRAWPRTPSLSDFHTVGNERRTQTVERLWGIDAPEKGSRKVGAGRLVWGISFEEILEEDGLIKDFAYSKDSGLLLNYIHRTSGDEESYFLANGSDKEGCCNCRFRVAPNMEPELWNPTDGTTVKCGIYTIGNGYIEIPVHFTPSGSVFVVFKKSDQVFDNVVSASHNGVMLGTDASTDKPLQLFRKGNGLHCMAYEDGQYEITRASGRKETINVRNKTSVVSVETPWLLKFPKGWGASEKVVLDSLVSLSEHPDFGVKHFSGTMSYSNTFDLTSDMVKHDRSVMLDLGDVQVIAEVSVNGKPFDLLWKPPFVLDITSAVQKGRNDIEVKVTNLWINRMIGDEYFPCDIKYRDGDHLMMEWPDWVVDGTQRPESERKTFSTIQAWTKDDKLTPSGLVGPVRMHIVENIDLNR